MKPIKPLTFDFVSNVDHHTQVAMTARLVRPGEGYGLYDSSANSYARKNADENGKPGKEMLVEFYDTRKFKRHSNPDNPVPGNFISRYYLSTLLEGKDLSEPIRGLCLDGGVYDWQVDGKSLRDVLKWADSHRKRLELPKDPNPLTFD